MSWQLTGISLGRTGDTRVTGQQHPQEMLRRVLYFLEYLLSLPPSMPPLAARPPHKAGPLCLARLKTISVQSSVSLSDCFSHQSTHIQGRH